jgi:glycosyltransferase involved in cell wall biosynthesis
VYDAIDVWDGALGAGWYDRRIEDDVLSRADHLIASARLLRDEIAARSARRVTLLPNAVALRRFDPDRMHPVPPDLRRGAPTVLYVGALWGSWLDLDLIAGLARALPEAAINLVGPTGSRELPRAPNVHVLGAKPQADVPAYLQAADVTIVPFLTDRLAEGVSPLKVFEAIAMRRPVVATPLPELEGIPGVQIAADTAAFASAVSRAAAQPWPEGAAAAFVASNTWAARVDALLAIAGVSGR